MTGTPRSRAISRTTPWKRTTTGSSRATPFASRDGQVSGTLSLAAPGASPLTVTPTLNESTALSAYDGAADFAGTSGHDFGVQSANGSNSASVTNASSLSAYIGTGTVSFNEAAHATSSASGADVYTRIPLVASTPHWHSGPTGDTLASQQAWPPALTMGSSGS